MLERELRVAVDDSLAEHRHPVFIGADELGKFLLDAADAANAAGAAGNCR